MSDNEQIPNCSLIINKRIICNLTVYKSVLMSFKLPETIATVVKHIGRLWRLMGSYCLLGIHFLMRSKGLMDCLLGINFLGEIKY